MNILRTNSKHEDFIWLVSKLDEFLAEMDGREHDFYNQYNKVDNINHVVLIYQNHVAVACGAIKEYNAETMEVKRMFTVEKFRNQGFASMILAELEKWVAELGYTKCILETGKRLPAAVHLYQQKGYVTISNYGQYINMENSICFQKELRDQR